jgi:hypothetical protein
MPAKLLVLYEWSIALFPFMRWGRRVTGKFPSRPIDVCAQVSSLPLLLTAVPIDAVTVLTQQATSPNQHQ